MSIPHPVFYIPGAPWPNTALPGGSMRVEAHAWGNKALIVLGIDMSGLAPFEKSAFLAARNRVAIIGRAHHVRVAVEKAPMHFDATFAPSLNGLPWRRLLDAALSGPATMLSIVCVDRGFIAAVQPVPMKAANWAVFRAAVAACPQHLKAAAYARACARDETRWRPADFMRIATCTPTVLSADVTVI